MATFSEKLQQATNEDKQVNPLYVQEIRKGITKVIGGNTRIDTESIVYPEIKTDGIFSCYYISDEDGIEYNYLLQLECKLDVDFNDTKARANVLLQVCCYLKQIHDKELGYNASWESNYIPKVIVLGSKINCLAVPAKLLLPFAMGYIEGFKSASTAHLRNENAFVINNIANDSNILAQSIIYDTSDKDCITRLCEEIVKLGKGLKITDDLTEHTVSLAFDFFDMYVLDQKSSDKLSSREKVDLFVGTFFNEEFEETKTSRFASSPDKLRIHGTEVKINSEKYNQFKLLYNMREYSRLEQKQITAITDRLIEDTDRRRRGDFYTPSIWVDEAHKLLDKNLGSNWRDEYMVWDCAWGTGNLTRDYQFADLYCSTLQEEDLNIGYRYNKGAVKFQYDFLNDDVEDMQKIETFCKLGKFDTANAILFNTKLYKQAPGLIDGLLGINGKEKKKLLFLINPPYGTSKNNVIGTENTSKVGVAKNAVNEIAIEDNMGQASRQLYALFMYRIMLIQNLFSADVKIGAFTQSDFMSTIAYDKFREKLYANSRFLGGFMMQGNEFNNVSGDIAISFTLFDFKGGKTEGTPLQVLEASNGKVVMLCEHNVHAADTLFNKTIRASIPTKFTEKKTMVPLKSALNVREDADEKIVQANCIGGFQCNGNAINYNDQYVALYSSPFHGAANMNVLESTALDVMSLFAARRLISGRAKTWYNWKDEYENPNKNDSRYSQFEADAIVYSLFESKSQQSSLRNIFYSGKQWNIQNEFFWMPVGEIAELAGGKYDTADINTTIEDDIEEFGKERFVYKKLQEVTLSPDAQAVLDKATELVKSSFKHRKAFNQSNPNYHINTWDAGWYQIKGLLKEYDPQGLKEFNELYKALEDRMRPLVYELGFLYK